MFKKKDIYHAAGYFRLSREDEDKAESDSIRNQKALIAGYLKNHPELKLIDEYVDDGFSGTNFERPGFKKMLEDAKNGLIDTIMVKDLSRLGRDYIYVGNYVEQVFPVLGIRFIAVSNYFDSSKYIGTTMGLEMALNSLINTFYSRDISKKNKIRYGDQVEEWAGNEFSDTLRIQICRKWEMGD